MPAEDALLGLATTRELLAELEARAATGVLFDQLSRHRGALRQLEEVVRRLRVDLPPAVLDYRTVDA